MQDVWDSVSMGFWTAAKRMWTVTERECPSVPFSSTCNRSHQLFVWTTQWDAFHWSFGEGHIESNGCRMTTRCPGARVRDPKLLNPDGCSSTPICVHPELQVTHHSKGHSWWCLRRQTIVLDETLVHRNFRLKSHGVLKFRFHPGCLLRICGSAF